MIWCMGGPADYGRIRCLDPPPASRFVRTNPATPLSGGMDLIPCKKNVSFWVVLFPIPSHPAFSDGAHGLRRNHVQTNPCQSRSNPVVKVRLARQIIPDET